MPSKPLRRSAKARTSRRAASAQAKPSIPKGRVTSVSPTKSKAPTPISQATARRVWLVGKDVKQRNSVAQAMANELQLSLTRIALGQVVSRYIGETEKNLNHLFAQAADQRWLLLFDEADSLFGKRTEVKDSHDRNANEEIAYLLQRIEQATVPLIIATNEKPSLDPAFLLKVAQLIELPLNRTPKIREVAKKAATKRKK